MDKKFSQITVRKQSPRQEGRLIRKKVTGSLCAGKEGGDRGTSNV